MKWLIILLIIIIVSIWLFRKGTEADDAMEEHYKKVEKGE